MFTDDDIGYSDGMSDAGASGVTLIGAVVAVEGAIVARNAGERCSWDETTGFGTPLELPLTSPLIEVAVDC